MKFASYHCLRWTVLVSFCSSLPAVIPGAVLADEPGKGDGGSVEIVLKLVPSAPENNDSQPDDSEDPEVQATPKGQPAPEQHKPSERGEQSQEKNQEARAEGGAMGDVKIKVAHLPSVPNRHSESSAAPEHGGVRPIKKPLRSLELQLVPPAGGARLEGEGSPMSNPRRSLADRTVPVDRYGMQECPGGLESNEAAGDLPSLPEDVPLEQEEHPFDVPNAVSAMPVSRPRSVPSGEPAQNPESHSDDALRTRIERLLDYYRSHPENVARRGPWALMHAILPLGVEAEVIAGNRRVNAIGWLCHNGVSARQRMFQPTQNGFRPNIGPGVQGHEGQFLAILAQCRVQPDYLIQVGQRKYSIQDLIRYEMATCREKSELTFKLIAFSFYLEADRVWKDNRGKAWTIEKLVAEELAQPVNGAACGGTHRLMGLSCAIIQREEAGLPISGHFSRARKFLDDFVVYTMTLQNPDGSFSTEWFERRANEPNLDRKIQTTGHILEWLVFTVSDEHLKKPEITRAAQFLADTLGKSPERDWPIGPRGHSLRALALYHQRMFGTSSPTKLDAVRVATEPSSPSTGR